MKRLAGLTSRWQTPAALATASPSHTSSVKSTFSSMDNVRSLRTLSSVCPRSSSITMNKRPLSSPMSKIVTMLRCASVAETWASRMNRARISGSDSRSVIITFTATSRPIRSSCAA
jgi:hypothetical protein